MALFSKLAGIVGSFFQIGGPAGPGWNNNSGALEARNAANNAYAVVRCTAPVGDNDAVNKAYADKVANKPVPVGTQFNGNNALPSNSATESWTVVTTSGANATIGQILWDDGSNTGTVTVLPAVAGNSFVTTVALSGGTISLAATQLYVWSGSQWINISPTISGAIFCIRMAITNAASQSSTTQIPANAIILDARLDVAVAYSAGATISLGITGSTALFMGTGDNTPQTTGLYQNMQDQSVGASAAALLVTVAGSPAAGSGFALISYSVPNS